MNGFIREINSLGQLKELFLATKSLCHFLFNGKEDGKIEVGPAHDLLGESEDTINYYVRHCPSGVQPKAWMDFLSQVFVSNSTEDVLIKASKIWALEGLFSDGVKLFVPSLEECEALSKINATFDMSEYRQPFETFSVAIPEGFSNDSRGAKPVGIVGRYCQKRKMFAYVVLFDGSSQYEIHGCSALVKGREMQSIFEQKWDGLDDYEEDISDQLKRIFLNACQILTQCRMRKVGYADQKAAAKLQWKIDNNPRAMRRAAQRELDKLPTIYGFDQHIRLFDTEGPLGQHHDGDGVRTLHPHWRRGHWRNQPHGTRNELRKLVFVRPCFVNPHLFAGDKFDTRVSMSVVDGATMVPPVETPPR